MTIMAVEWQGVLNRGWNSKIPLVFAQIVIMKNLGVCRARNTRASVVSRIELWERGIRTGMVADAEEEDDAREISYSGGEKEEEEYPGRKLHRIVMSGNLFQDGRWVTDRERGGFLLLDDICKNTSRPVVEVLRQNHPDM